MRPIAIHSAKKAVTDFNKKMQDFHQLHARIQEHRMNKANTIAEPAQPSMDTHLRSMGMPATHAVKLAIAKQMGIHPYIGSKEQDAEMLMSHQGMMDARAQHEQTMHDRAQQAQELALKAQPKA